MKALDVALKDLRIILADRGALVGSLLLPLIFIVIFSGALTALGQAPADERIALPLADDDGGEAALALARGIEAAGGVHVEPYGEAEALALLDEAKIGRLLVIPAGFTRDLAAGQQVTLRLVNHPDADPEVNRAVQLVIEGVAADMALESQLLASLEQMGAMMADAPADWRRAFSVERMQAQARSQFPSSGAVPLITVSQRQPQQPAKPSSESTSSDMAVSGFAVLFVFLTAQTTARSIYDEKKGGSFRRLLAAPLSKAELLAGKVIPNFVMALVQMAVIFLFATAGLRLLGMKPASLGSDPLALLLVVALIALCSSALGILIAAVARTENQIGGLSMVLMWVLGLVGGSLVPLFLLERLLGPLPRIIPHYWANRALNNLMLRDLGLAGVTTEMAALLAFTALFFGIGLWRFRFDR